MNELLSIISTLIKEGHELSCYNGFGPGEQDIIIKLRKGNKCATYRLNMSDLSSEWLALVLNHLKIMLMLEESDSRVS